MAHYDCTCCGESMGISHDHCPECQAGRCSRQSGFKPGDIVRWHDKWGVCVKPKFASVPMFAWFDEDGEFLKEIGTTDKDVSAPFHWGYPGIPETILVRATAERLTA